MTRQQTITAMNEAYEMHQIWYFSYLNTNLESDKEGAEKFRREYEALKARLQIKVAA